VRGKEAVEELPGIHGGAARDRLCQVGQADQDEQDERHRREQRVEGERAREERDVVFVGGLQGAAEEAGRGAVPPAGPDRFQAIGSS
jgi:hypothetical protein